MVRAKSKKTYGKYTPAFRLRAVTGFCRSGKTLRAFARKLGIPHETLRCWVIGKYTVSPMVKDAKNGRAKKKSNAKK